MTYDGRLLVVAFSTFTLATTTGSFVAFLAAKPRSGHSPAGRARTLFRLRLLPATVATVVTAQAFASFVLFEPRLEHEPVGLILSALAAVGFALYAVGLSRWARVSLVTNRVIGGWMRTARTIELPGASIPCYCIDVAFPVVAVAGILRPRLVVAKQVLEACSPPELRAIVAHETRHIDNWDNLRRTVMMCLPDPLSATGAGDRLLAQWHEATEEAADDAAGEHDDEGRCHLAAALLNVARLVPANQPVAFLPASALYRGEDLARRVRRLVGGAAPPPLHSPSIASWMSGVSVLVAIGALALPVVHQLVEAAVTYLP